MKKITAIITPTWNNEDYTIRCFESIKKNTNNYIIIWVDNGSLLESRKKVEDFLNKNEIPYEAIYNQENLGFVKATNQGMRKALELGADYLVLENNDTEVYEGWLERMIETAESDEKIGLVGPITSPCTTLQSIINLKDIYGEEFKDLPEYQNNPEEYAALIRNLYNKESIESKTELAFFSVLIKDKVVKKIGFLSEEFGVGFGDDNDYCLRAKKAGWKLFLAKDVFVFHNHRTTFKSIYSKNQIEKMLKKNSEIYKKKHSSFIENMRNNRKEKDKKQELIDLKRELEITKHELEKIKNTFRWKTSNFIYQKIKIFLDFFIKKGKR